MCGVIGYWPILPEPQANVAFERLLMESRVRGLHACGIASGDGAELSVFRAFEASELLEHFDNKLPTIAHTRYSTSGDWKELTNNQPLLHDSFMALAFNGVIHMGTKEEFEKDFDVECAVDNDGEIFIQRLLKGETAQEFIGRIKGAFAGVWLHNGKLYAGRNERRPLWFAEQYGALWVASTADIFRRAGFTLSVPIDVGVRQIGGSVMVQL